MPEETQKKTRLDSDLGDSVHLDKAKAGADVHPDVEDKAEAEPSDSVQSNQEEPGKPRRTLADYAREFDESLRNTMNKTEQERRAFRLQWFGAEVLECWQGSPDTRYELSAFESDSDDSEQDVTASQTQQEPQQQRREPEQQQHQDQEQQPRSARL